MEATACKENTNLRDFAAKCFGEFVKYTIKQQTPKQLKKNYVNIKSVVGRIESSSTNPDPYKRYGSIMTMKAILYDLAGQEFLVEKYIFELLKSFLNIVKQNHYSEQSEKILMTCESLFRGFRKAIMKNWVILS